MTEPWGLLVRRGGDALVQGRLREAERLAGQALELRPGEPAPALLAVAACREQGRAAEVEVLLRRVLTERPEVVEGQALLGALLVDLGRDGEARRQLDLLDLHPAGLSPAVAALAAEAAAGLHSVGHAEALVAPLGSHAPAPAGWHGSLSRHLGLVCHVLGRWDEAEAHLGAALEANAAAGAPVLLAHTRRHYAALLRARCDPGDWERATDLLSAAADVYRRLDIGPRADEAEAVLRRSQDPLGGAAVNVFRRAGAGWALAFDGQVAEVAGGPGLGHIAELLAGAGRPAHVVDLVEAGADLDIEYRRRLAELAGRAAAAADPLVAAVARAEADVLCAELPAGHDDAGDRARRLAALRIRVAIDDVEVVLPSLAHHLRRSIRTGTFCHYEPDGPARWETGPR
ncbi:MAG TPA: hypothetical protein VM388_03015 [Acidimicrobiales bacterium]|nr:hypothetical protein [Acidimicrobiales bacterium]